MATTAYLDIDQGSNFSVEFELENDNSTPMNLSGFSAYSQFRKSYNSTIGYSFNASVVSPVTAGKIKLTLSGAQSSQIKPGRYLYDVEIVNLDGIKTRVVEGIVTINAEITKIP